MLVVAAAETDSVREAAALVGRSACCSLRIGLQVGVSAQSRTKSESRNRCTKRPRREDAVPVEAKIKEWEQLLAGAGLKSEVGLALRKKEASRCDTRLGCVTEGCVTEGPRWRRRSCVKRPRRATWFLLRSRCRCVKQQFNG